MGGVNLFNENYYRGVENLQKKYDALEGNKRKQYNEK
jgi:hypothetical protein